MKTLFEIPENPKRATASKRLSNGRFASELQSEISNLKKENEINSRMRKHYEILWMAQYERNKELLIEIKKLKNKIQ